VEVVDVDLILYDRAAEVIGFAVDLAGFYACAGEPGTVAVGVVTSAVGAVGGGGAAKLGGPDARG
jgi:hypothetical protein